MEVDPTLDIPIASLTRTKREGHPALWIGGGTVKDSFKGVVHCTANMNLRKPIHTRKTENSDVLRQAMVGIGPGDLIFYVEGKPPIERGNRSIRARACKIKDRQDAASTERDGTEAIEEPLARSLFFDLVEKNPKVKRGLIKGVHDGKDFVETEDGELEEDGLELHEAGDHGEAIGKLSEVPEEFMGHKSAEALAESHRALGEYEEALRWYEGLPGSVENISSEAVCYIKTGRYEEASELCEDLLGMIDEPGEVPDPDVQGLVLEKQGKYREAAGKYEDDGLVERLLEDLEEAGEDRERILVLEELHDRSRDEEYLEMLEEAAMENEDELTVGFKAGLSVGGDRRGIVVCDTNILVYKAFEEIGISSSSRGRIGSALRKFSQLASEGNRVLLPGAVERELEPVCERKLEDEDDLGEEEKERVRERVERYREKYGPGDLPVDAPIEEGECMERAREFYRSYPDKLHEITERKISENPEKKHEILLKRAEMGPSKGATPGEGDVRLLAECIRLSETPIPGVWRVSLLSNDSDFLWFSSEIEREFGIRVHDI